MKINANTHVSIKKILLLIISCSSLILSGCAYKLGGDDYEVSSVGEINTTLKGVIVAARPIKIRANAAPAEPGLGAATGGIGGAILGSTVGGGNKMPAIAAVVGGLAGGFAGHTIEQKIKTQNGVEYQVKLDGGDLVTIAQGAEPKMVVGQRVLLIQSNRDLSVGRGGVLVERNRSRSRIVPDNTASNN